MQKLVVIFWLAFMLLCPCTIKAQHITINRILDAWKTDDTTQTHEAEKTYKSIKSIPNATLFIQQRDMLAHWIKENPDTRLEIRFMMYDIVGRYDFHLPVTKTDYQKMRWAIAKVHALKDEQLKAELYALYAQLDFEGGAHFLLYNLKALELQRKLGFHLFSFVHNRFFNISYSLYHIDDFRQSILFGREGLKFKNVEIDKWDPRVYIFMLDIVGASYLHLGMPDSAKYYYGQIIDTLTKKPDKQAYVQNLWLAIAKGNIGHALIMQHKEAEGLPLVEQSYRYFTDVQAYNNIAIFGNVLAQENERHQRYGHALSIWKLARHAAVTGAVPSQEITALAGMALCYKQLKMPDSAYKYYSLYYRKKEERSNFINAQKLSNQRAKIRFDDLQSHLENTTLRLAKEKTTRNFILLGISLLTIIGLLLYNHQRLKAKYKAAQLERERQQAENEAEQAKAQIKTFIANIREKEELINHLKQTIDKNYIAENGQKQVMLDNLQSHVLLTDGEWYKFREAFQKAHPLFLPQLKELMPNLSPAEERLASLLSLQLNNLQIANILGISADSVARSKRRLKQRILLPPNEALEDFLFKLNSLNLG